MIPLEDEWEETWEWGNDAARWTPDRGAIPPDPVALSVTAHQPPAPEVGDIWIDVGSTEDIHPFTAADLQPFITAIQEQIHELAEITYTLGGET